MRLFQCMKTLKTSLKEMLETAQIGELKPNLERSQVCEIMGNPETWSVLGKNKKQDNADIWKYGILEYSFGGLPYIALEVHSGDKFPENIQIEGFFPDASTSLKDFERFLEQNQLKATVDATLTFGDQITLNVGKASVGFMDNLIFHIFLKNQ